MSKLKLIPLASAALLLFSCGGNGGGGGDDPQPEPTEIKINKLTLLDVDSYALTSEKFNVTEGEEITFTIPVSALTEEHKPTQPVDAMTLICDGEDKSFSLAEKPTSFIYNNDDVIFSDAEANTWFEAALSGGSTYNDTYIVASLSDEGPSLFFEHTSPRLGDVINITFTSTVEKENVTAMFKNITPL